MGTEEQCDADPGPMCATLETILCKFGCMRNLTDACHGEIERRIPPANSPSPPKPKRGAMASDASIPSQVYLYSHSETRDESCSEDARLKFHKIVGTMSSKELNNHTGLTVDTTKMSSTLTSNDAGDAYLDNDGDSAESAVIYQHQFKFGFGLGLSSDKDSGSNNFMVGLDQSVSSISCPSFADHEALYSTDHDDPQDLLLVGSDQNDEENEIDLVSRTSHAEQRQQIGDDDSLLSFDRMSSASKHSDPLHSLLSFDSAPDAERRDDVFTSKSSNSQLRVGDICNDSLDESLHHSVQDDSSRCSRVTSRDDELLLI